MKEGRWAEHAFQKACPQRKRSLSDLEGALNFTVAWIPQSSYLSGCLDFGKERGSLVQ